MKVVFSHYSFQKLQKLNKKTQTRIIQKLKFYTTQKDPLKFAKHLTDRELGQFSFRIGDYRIVFDFSRGAIFIIDVDRRDKVYK